jgi:hypothetical protein
MFHCFIRVSLPRQDPSQRRLRHRVVRGQPNGFFEFTSCAGDVSILQRLLTALQG